MLARASPTTICRPISWLSPISVQANRHGADIYSIAKILGHRDVEVTARIYVHNELDELKRATRYTRRQQTLAVQNAAA